MLRLDPFSLGLIFLVSLITVLAGVSGPTTKPKMYITMDSVSEYIAAPQRSVEIIIEVEPKVDLCAPTDGELSPDRPKGHAMDVKPWGCI